jgi:hypothetical protein
MILYAERSIRKEESYTAATNREKVQYRQQQTQHLPPINTKAIPYLTVVKPPFKLVK